MKKRLAALLALCMMLGAGALAECGYNPMEDQYITGAAGSRHLAINGSSCRLDASQTIATVCAESGTNVLCLHGQTVSQITVADGATLTLVDCTGGGSVKSDNIAVENHGTFTMHGGSVEAGNIAVDNNGTFMMHGGSVQSPNSAVYNRGTFTQENGILSGSVINRSEYNLHGGSVTVGMTDGIGVNNYDGGQFTMDGGSVTATGSEGIGIDNKGSFRIRAGRIEGGKASHGRAVRCWKKAPNSSGGVISYYYPLSPAEAEAACIDPDSAVLDGGFGKSFVVVGPASSGGLDEADSLPETGSLPQTGDPSMLGAWVCLLGASGAMGLKLRRKK